MFLCSQQLQLLASIREVGGGALTERRWFPLVTHLRSSANMRKLIWVFGKLFNCVKLGIGRDHVSYDEVIYMTWRTMEYLMDIVADV